MAQFNANWQYRIVGNTTKQQDVINAINTAQIPNVVNFSYNPTMPMKYAPWDGRYPGKQIWPWPAIDWGIIIVDASTIPDIAYAGGSPGKNCSVARWFWEDSLTFGLRIWHEISHAMGINVDMLNWQTPGNDCARFCSYVMSDARWKDNYDIKTYCAQKINSLMTNTVLKAYYTMLWEQAGFTKPPTPVPPTPPKPVFTQLVVTTVNSYEQNKAISNVNISATSSVGSALGTSNQVGKLNILIPCGIPISFATRTPSGTTRNFNNITFPCSSNISITLPVGN